jgi:uncharacterized protein
MSPHFAGGKTMGLMKLLVLALVVFALLTLWRRIQAKSAARSKRAQRADTPQTMVRCSHCRVHVPEKKALRSQNGWYCCAEHRDTHNHE